jgi:hypothetical protein
METERGLEPEHEFVMDLQVSDDFVPVISDGEVAKFQLMPMDEVRV